MPAKWYKLTEEHKEILRQSRKLQWNPMQWKKHTEETKNKQRLSALWRKMSQKAKDKISRVKKWSIPRNKWKTIWPHSEESNKKRSEALKWDKSHLWEWWKTYELYTVDWTQTLKRSIRERDNYVCRICGKQQWDKAHDVHHIDYNKKNCNPSNLITLCNICHIKTNTKREYWIKYFNNLSCEGC